MKSSGMPVGTKAGRPQRDQVRGALSLLLAMLLVCPSARAQQYGSEVAASDLASQNLSRVAASAPQIEEVVRKEPGLLVELKRWAAKDATDRGQMVEDADLTDQAIFDRLARDLEFRGVATRLLQRYGYLIPRMNPESEAAKEQELVRQQRVRRLTKAAEIEDDEVLRAKFREKDKAPDQASSRDRTAAELERRTRERRLETISPREMQLDALPLDLRYRTSQLSLLGNPLDEMEMASRRSLPMGAESDLPADRRSTDFLNSSVGTPGAAWENPAARMAELGGPGVLSPPAREERIYPRRPSALGVGEKRTDEELDHPVIVRRPNPFADIPSLYDMYKQVSSRQPELKRFGLDVFRNSTADSDLVPMDLPAGPDYVVGPGDGLTIDLWGSVSQRLYRTVDREGRLSLPEVGPVLVSGRTLGEVQQAVQQILRTQFRDISADASLWRLRSIRVYVVGDVEEPGAYDVSSLSTPLNALFAAGGPTQRGSLRILRHFRGKQLVQEVDVYDLLLQGVRSDMKRLENGDTVLVPPIGPQVTIEGAVRRPAIYELRGEKTLAEVLELAGGILPTASLRKIQVQRVETHEKRTMLSLDVSETQDAEAVRKQLESFSIREGDEVRIFPIAPHNQDAIYLQGHVLRPGQYSYRSGLKVTELVSSYADLLPEPAVKYAEIIRLNPPDYRPSVESFDLAAALANPATAPTLQPLDTLRIFSRYDFENPPTVWVGGEVRNPGPFRTSGQIHLRDAIYLAGGFTPDALLDDAQVFRHLADSKLTIMSLNLKEALAGNPLENILLQPRDHILVHRNLAKTDPPTIYIKGEVAKPGRYPLTANMRAGDLIRLADGLKRSADTEAADLTRYLVQNTKQQVGEHQEINVSAALAGDPNHDVPLRDGDTLTIRQRPGWNEIGASVAVLGEVQHTGTYPIRPGERLSSVLKRAGGFLPTAYALGAVLQREEIRRLQEKSKQELIQRMEQDAANVKVAITTSGQEQVALQQAALQQRERVVQKLKETPVSGRLVVKLRTNLAGFENSPDDIEMRAGDTLSIPKRPDFVVVTGQVYNSNAITYGPRKNAGWYLRQAGGPTALADKGGIFIVRADGSVVSGGSGGWWGKSVLSVRVEPGDTIVVPEKPIGGSTFWRNLLTVAQIAQSAAITSLIVRR